MNLYMTTLSNSHMPPTILPPKPPQTGRQVDGTCRVSYCSGGGRVSNIDSHVYCTWIEEREGGRRRFPYKANSRPISSHVLSGEVGVFFPFFKFFFFSSPPSPTPILSFIFILLREKKNKVKKGCPPSSQQREEGVQIALQKTGLRAEISHNAADKKVGHITFGWHVTGIQTVDGIVKRIENRVGRCCCCGCSS